jgi:hypothetical protein
MAGSSLPCPGAEASLPQQRIDRLTTSAKFIPKRTLSMNLLMGAGRTQKRLWIYYFVAPSIKPIVDSSCFSAILSIAVMGSDINA